MNTRDAVATFVAHARASFGRSVEASAADGGGRERTLPAVAPLTTEMVDALRGHVETLARTLVPTVEGDVELHRDPDHGFLLLAHRERAGRYRAPHDHGLGWVIYAVARGEVELGTYARIDGHLVRRGVERLGPGDARVYLPGDIHDTRIVSDDVVMLRFTSRDLKAEEARATR